MELRDYLATAALAISLVSLAFSIRTFVFNRRVKVAELRANVLARAAEVLGQLNNVHDLNERMLLHANTIGDDIGSELVSRSKISTMKARFDQMYSRLVGTPVNQGLELYERFFHDFTALREDTMRLEQATQKNYDRYLAIRQAPRSGPNNSLEDFLSTPGA